MNSQRRCNTVVYLSVFLQHFESKLDKFRKQKQVCTCTCTDGMKLKLGMYIVHVLMI